MSYGVPPDSRPGTRPGSGPGDGPEDAILGTPLAGLLARASWPVALALGVGTLLIGVFTLVWPGKTLVVVAVLFGIYLLLSGILQFAHAFNDRFGAGTRVLMFASGTLSVVLGLLCFRSAEQSVVLLGLWIGIGWLFRGFAELAAAITAPELPGRGWIVFLGIVSVLAGMVLITSPVTSIVVLAVLAGWWLAALGVFEIVTALRLRHSTRTLD
ncbi:HdeD family acid-resistance protein [Streptacidiphilus sp. PB12-B1b]|uniref:HdeD family acid-resistance protein n=1 Tax=Streptacidiphilus sp. PB12-B1b TaxID=2705012 RepID=UPI0015FC5F43|nr:HdeD family acid-resistance protein [Streptacidiphilus sp. PB12-B1b]QMU79569.1 HdeD family acid-resistance protein [Streptacidiphilus sp. PB12-B1b]